MCRKNQLVWASNTAQCGVEPLPCLKFIVLNNVLKAYTINIMININNILRCFPNNVVRKIDEYFVKNNINLNYLEEIRIRVNRPIIMKLVQAEIIIEYNITSEEILDILQQICDNSIYSYQNQIANRIYYLKRRT